LISSLLGTRRHQFWRAGDDFGQMERALRGNLLHERKGEVEDRHSAFSFALWRSMMGMAVKHAVERIAIQWFFQSAAAQKRIDFQRFAFHGFRNRRVVQQSVAMFGSEAR